MFLLYYYYISVCRIKPIQKGAARRLHPFFITNHIFILFIITFLKIIQRAISLQKVHLWMDCGKRILWSWTQSNATKIRAATVQSSVWTLQQILPDKLPFDSVCNSLSPNLPEGNLFAESPPLDGLWQAYFMELDAVHSDKNTCSYCPEQRVDAATDIARQTIVLL